MNYDFIGDSSRLPNVLVLTDCCISMNHGTGTSLLRHFSAYPENLGLNVYSFQGGEPAFQQYCRIRPKLLPGLLMKGVVKSGISQLNGFRNQLEILSFQKSLRNKIEQSGFIPDIIYSTCYGFRGFIMLSKLASEYGSNMPIIQHFFDYQRHDNEAMSTLLKQLSPAITEVWSLTETMAEEVAEQMERPVELVRIFNCDLPETYKQTHRELTPDFKAVMVGNCWIPELLLDVRNAWHYLMEKISGLKPIRWYGHPATIAKLRKNKVQIEPEIEYVGFLPTHDFFRQLQKADMAIIPFNREAIPENDYARFSLPSRITEMASVGLPIFCAAGPQTEIQRYIESKNIGVCSLPSNIEQFQNDLFCFMQNKEQRAFFGMNARKLAIDEFDIRQYQAWFYKKLTAVAGCHGRQF
ncbi:MAG: glycosyltransferase [Moorea sp. SIO4A3]|nr:glycosyltransferase [Moorena sp. SIO4A3]